jgi:hypothetical protein
MNDKHDDSLPIDHNVPIPPQKDSYVIHKKLTQTFNKLEPGDSFWYPASTHSTVIKGIHRRAKEKGWKAATRTEKRDGKWGVRIWRIK